MIDQQHFFRCLDLLMCNLAHFLRGVNNFMPSAHSGGEFLMTIFIQTKQFLWMTLSTNVAQLSESFWFKCSCVDVQWTCCFPQALVQVIVSRTAKLHLIRQSSHKNGGQGREGGKEEGRTGCGLGHWGWVLMGFWLEEFCWPPNPIAGGNGQCSGGLQTSTNQNTLNLWGSVMVSDISPTFQFAKFCIIMFEFWQRDVTTIMTLLECWSSHPCLRTPIQKPRKVTLHAQIPPFSAQELNWHQRSKKSFFAQTSCFQLMLHSMVTAKTNTPWRLSPFFDLIELNFSLFHLFVQPLWLFGLELWSIVASVIATQWFLICVFGWVFHWLMSCCDVTLTMASCPIPLSDNVDNDQQCHVILFLVLRIHPSLLTGLAVPCSLFVWFSPDDQQCRVAFFQLTFDFLLCQMTGGAVSICLQCIPDGNAVSILCFLAFLFWTSFWMTSLSCYAKSLNMHHSVFLKWAVTKANCFRKEALLASRQNSKRVVNASCWLQESWTVLMMTSAWIQHNVADSMWRCMGTMIWIQIIIWYTGPNGFTMPCKGITWKRQFGWSCALTLGCLWTLCSA